MSDKNTKKALLKEQLDKLMSQFSDTIDEKVNHVFASGTLDVDNLDVSDDNYTLAKFFMCALGKEMSHQYKHPNSSRKQTKTIESIYGAM